MNCFFCKALVGPTDPSEKTIKKVAARAGMEISGRVCSPCWYNRLGIAKIQTRFRPLVGNARAVALAALMREDYQTFVAALEQVESDFARAEDRIRKARHQLDQFARIRNDVFSLKNEIEVAMHKSEFGRYVIRRRAANAVISNPEVRRRIFARDGFRCLKCGAVDPLSIDHIKSVVSGGGDEDSNLQTLCGPCNSSKRCVEISFRKEVPCLSK